MSDLYSIVKDSNSDLGVLFSIVQNWPTIEAVCTKSPNFFFCIFAIILLFLRSHHFFYVEYLSLNSHFLTRTINDYGPTVEFQFSTVKSTLLLLLYCSWGTPTPYIGFVSRKKYRIYAPAISSLNIMDESKK